MTEGGHEEWVLHICSFFFLSGLIPRPTPNWVPLLLLPLPGPHYLFIYLFLIKAMVDPTKIYPYLNSFTCFL